MFQNRLDAAWQLIPKLLKYKANPEAVILAIPRGALQIGAVLRDELKIPLDIVVTKKIGAPGNEEFAIGVVGPDGKAELNTSVIDYYGIPEEYLKQEAERLKTMIRERYREYRGNAELPNLKGKIAIVVDDGLATGFTALAAVHTIRRQQAKKIVLAVPVAATDSYEKLKAETDEIICLHVRDDFYAVGQFYSEFPQVSDDEAKKLLKPLL